MEKDSRSFFSPLIDFTSFHIPGWIIIIREPKLEAKNSEITRDIWHFENNRGNVRDTVPDDDGNLLYLVQPNTPHSIVRKWKVCSADRSGILRFELSLSRGKVVGVKKKKKKFLCLCSCFKHFFFPFFFLLFSIYIYTLSFDRKGFLNIYFRLAVICLAFEYTRPSLTRLVNNVWGIMLSFLSAPRSISNWENWICANILMWISLSFYLRHK